MKLKKLLTVVMAVVLVLTAFAACSKGGKENVTKTVSDADYVTEKGTLVVGITDYAPMDYKEKGSDEWTGFDAELARAVADKMGVKVEFVVIEWDNKFLELNTKSIDCVWNGMTITDEVKKNTSVSNAYARNRQVVVMKNDKAKNIKSVEDLSGLKFAVENGSSGQAAAEDNKLEATAVSTQADTLLEVKSGSVDAAIIDSTMADAMTGEGTDYADLGVAIVLQEEQYGIGFRKGSDLTEKVNGYLDELKADGTLQSLSEKYTVEIME
ncbi:MAG: transporter substrate-binding domain-containing protein [Eubacterium sp.]|nr:transporter substrate-binding domain-containing protein [Eubacterium sp.]